MTASSEEFYLKISRDGGSFELEHTWSSAEITDNRYQQGIVDNIDVTDASNVRIQFICNGDTNKDRVFIDDVAIEATVGSVVWGATPTAEATKEGLPPGSLCSVDGDCASAICKGSGYCK